MSKTRKVLNRIPVDQATRSTYDQSILLHSQKQKQTFKNQWRCVIDDHLQNTSGNFQLFYETVMLGQQATDKRLLSTKYASLQTGLTGLAQENGAVVPSASVNTKISRHNQSVAKTASKHPNISRGNMFKQLIQSEENPLFIKNEKDRQLTISHEMPADDSEASVMPHSIPRVIRSAVNRYKSATSKIRPSPSQIAAKISILFNQNDKKQRQENLSMKADERNNKLVQLFEKNNAEGTSSYVQYKQLNDDEKFQMRLMAHALSSVSSRKELQPTHMKDLSPFRHQAAFKFSHVTSSMTGMRIQENCSIGHNLKVTQFSSGGISKVSSYLSKPLMKNISTSLNFNITSGPATQKSKNPPFTNIPQIDEHYRNFDTQKHINLYNKVAEYERAKDSILHYWQIMKTPESETSHAMEYLRSCIPTPTMHRYLSFIQKYYKLKSSISGVVDLREQYLKDLTVCTQGFNLKEFSTKAVKIIIILRQLTVKLVKMVAKWYKFVVGGCFLIELKQDPRQQSHALRSSKTTAHQYLRKDQASGSYCLICQISRNEASKNFGPLMQKFVSTYIQDTVFFLPKDQIITRQTQLLQEKITFSKMAQGLKTTITPPSLGHDCNIVPFQLAFNWNMTEEMESIDSDHSQVVTPRNQVFEMAKSHLMKSRADMIPEIRRSLSPSIKSKSSRKASIASVKRVEDVPREADKSFMIPKQSTQMTIKSKFDKQAQSLQSSIATSKSASRSDLESIKMFKTEKSVKEKTVQSEIPPVTSIESPDQKLETTRTMPTHKNTLANSLRIEEQEPQAPVVASQTQTVIAEDEEAAIKLENQGDPYDYRIEHPMWLTQSNGAQVKIITKGSLKHVGTSELVSHSLGPETMSAVWIDPSHTNQQSANSLRRFETQKIQSLNFTSQTCRQSMKSQAEHREDLDSNEQQTQNLILNQSSLINSSQVMDNSNQEIHTQNTQENVQNQLMIHSGEAVFISSFADQSRMESQDDQ